MIWDTNTDDYRTQLWLEQRNSRPMWPVFASATKTKKGSFLLNIY